MTKAAAREETAPSVEWESAQYALSSRQIGYLGKIRGLQSEYEKSAIQKQLFVKMIHCFMQDLCGYPQGAYLVTTAAYGDDRRRAAKKGRRAFGRMSKKCPHRKLSLPILFAIAMNRKEADKASKILEEMKVRTLLVIGRAVTTDDVGDSTDTEDMISQDASTGRQIPKDALRMLVNKLGRPGETLDVEGQEIACDYDAVVSVYMLKEGWDVNCVEVMVAASL